MKPRSIICASVLAMGVTASALTTTNTFARLPVESPYASTIIALPFSGCGMAEGSIYVTNLVMTANLEAGDTLLYYNGTKWDAWEIVGDNWSSIATSTKVNGVNVTPPASEVAIACGKACWLNRKTPSNKFYLYGQVNAAKTDVEVAAGTGSTPTYTIVGCPYEAGTFDIKNIVGEEGDTILLMATNAAGKVEYTYKDHAWRKYVQTAPASGAFPQFTPANYGWEALGASDGLVPAGCGFMYGRKADSSLTITWGD